MKEPWVRDGALELDVLEQTDARYSFNVTRCRYTEVYKELGLEDLGFFLSCNRDATLIEGFSPDLELRRTQTAAQTATQAPLPGRARLVVDCDYLKGTGTQFRCMTIPGVASS